MISKWFSIQDVANQIGLSRPAVNKYRKKITGSQYEKTIKHQGKDRVLLSDLFIREVERLREAAKKPFIISKPEQSEKDKSDIKEDENLDVGLHFQDDGTMVMVYTPEEYNQLVYQLKDYNRLSKEYQEVKNKLDQATEKLFTALENANAIQQQLNYIKAKEYDKE